MNPGNNSCIEDEPNLSEQSYRKGLDSRKKSDSSGKGAGNENSIQLFQIVTKLAEEFHKVSLENQEFKSEIVKIF